MPGNLHGHGMGNVELSREAQYQEDHWDRQDHGHRGRGGGFRGRDRDWGGDRYNDGRGGRGASDYRRDGRDWDSRGRDRRDDDRDRGYRGRQRGRRDWEDDRRHERRDYRDRDSEGKDYRDRDSEGRRSSSRSHSDSGSQGGQRSEKPPVALPATEDWSDDEITEVGTNEAQTESLHKNVADELANFDKQFLPSKSEDKP